MVPSDREDAALSEHFTGPVYVAFTIHYVADGQSSVEIQRREMSESGFKAIVFTMNVSDRCNPVECRKGIRVTLDGSVRRLFSHGQ